MLSLALVWLGSLQRVLPLSYDHSLTSSLVQIGYPLVSLLSVTVLSGGLHRPLLPSCLPRICGKLTVRMCIHLNTIFSSHICAFPVPFTLFDHPPLSLRVDHSGHSHSSAVQADFLATQVGTSSSSAAQVGILLLPLRMSALRPHHHLSRPMIPPPPM